MLTERLQKILLIEEQERSFYLQQLKPALNRLEHAENLHEEHINIKQLLSGTAFEHALHNAEAAGEHTQATLEHLYKLNHICHDLLHSNRLARQSEVELLLNEEVNPELNPIALYYLGRIYSQGDSERDCQIADHYLQQALLMPVPDTQEDLSKDILELLAQNYDRWQLKRIPAQPQKYGTIYADHHDVAKGLEKNRLIPPYSGYVYSLAELELARQELGLDSWVEQERKRKQNE